MASVLGNTWKNKYAEELVQTAKALVAPGKGILAADESTSTIGKRVRRGLVLGSPVALWHDPGWGYRPTLGDLFFSCIRIDVSILERCSS